jgi:outer membrane protein OmpA-like peptidoglycan-associated protein
MKFVPPKSSFYALLSIALIFSLRMATVNAEEPQLMMGSSAIIEALKPKPKTRSLRNLKVEPAPSVSLTIEFEFDSANLSKSSTTQLEQLASALTSEELKALSFSVEGHTDAKGSLSYNMKLSERRAYTVRDFLVSKGVNGEILLAKGFGPTDLAEPDKPLSSVNRRVRIVTLDKN